MRATASGAPRHTVDAIRFRAPIAVNVRQCVDVVSLVNGLAGATISIFV